MLCIQDQEYFMHLLYDVIHVGININNLAYRIYHYKEQYGEENISNILSSKMKDEKYSNEMVYPLIKIIFMPPAEINNNLKLHYETKLTVLQMFEKNGANMKVICGKVPKTLKSISRYDPLFLDQKNNDKQLIDLYYSNQLIDENILKYLRQFDNIEIEI
jgi:hypothetical protein